MVAKRSGAEFATIQPPQSAPLGLIGGARSGPTYQVARGKNELIGNRLFYEQLKRDRQLVKRKYGKRKGRATRGLTTSSLFPQVEYRPLAEYERHAQGGGSWNS